MTVTDRIADLASRLRRSLRMDRNAEPFFLEQDEIAQTLEDIAIELAPFNSPAAERLQHDTEARR